MVGESRVQEMALVVDVAISDTLTRQDTDIQIAHCTGTVRDGPRQAGSWCRESESLLTVRSYQD